jgi:ADP-ribose pyrophosphatase
MPSDEAATLDVATGLVYGTAESEPSEALETSWVPFDEALAMTLDGRITDAMSIVGLQRVALDRAGRSGMTTDKGA